MNAPVRQRHRTGFVASGIAAAVSKSKTPDKTEEPIVAYKGFDKNLSCRGFKYEVGETYRHQGTVSTCLSGFHSCEMPLDAWNYYPPTTSRFAIVEASGQIDRRDESDTKIASATIMIKTELQMPELIAAAIKWILGRTKENTATGDSGHAAATGYYGHAAATGDSGHAAATGDSGHAAATGRCGCAFAGFNGRAKAGANGSFAITWFDESKQRSVLIVGTPGENGIKPDTWYRVKNGSLVEDE